MEGQGRGLDEILLFCFYNLTGDTSLPPFLSLDIFANLSYCVVLTNVCELFATFRNFSQLFSCFSNSCHQLISFATFANWVWPSLSTFHFLKFRVAGREVRRN